jgi:hypothetical protein
MEDTDTIDIDTGTGLEYGNNIVYKILTYYGIIVLVKSKLSISLIL